MKYTPEEKVLARRAARKKWKLTHSKQHKDIQREYQRRYRKIEKNRKRHSQEESTRRKNRLKTDPGYRLLSNLRKRLWDALTREVKSAPTLTLLGCTILQLREHLEARFKPGMTWENYGPVWHVDHIKPCAKFDLNDPAQQRVCFHFSNLQPLFANENLQKGNRE